MYLVAPNGYAVFLTADDFLVTNKKMLLSNDPALSSIKTHNATSSDPESFQPRGNLNSLHVNGQTTKGKWQLYAKTNGAPTTLNSWKITFGPTNISKGATNQSCATALPLTNTTLTGNMTLGTNKYNGIVINPTDPKQEADEIQMDNDDPNFTETSVWYSFVPKCSNDRIEVRGETAYLYLGILNSCTSKTPMERGELLGSTYTSTINNFVPGQTYYLAMDGSQGDNFEYSIKWTEGTQGCPSITTGNTPQLSYCLGDSLDLPFSHTGLFGANNVFTAQLSNESGDFASPTIVGATTNANATSVRIKFPFGKPFSLGYKLRVVASSPNVIGSPSDAFEVIRSPNLQVSEFHPDVCSNDQNITYSVKSEVNGTSPTLYKWTFSNGISSPFLDESSVDVNFPTVTSLTVVTATVNVSMGACKASLSRTINLRPKVTPAVLIKSDKDSICQGQSLTFTATLQHPGTSPSYVWKIDQFTTSNRTPIFTTSLLRKGEKVTLELTSNEFCTVPLDGKVLSNPLAPIVTDTIAPQVSMLGEFSICKGVPTSYQANSSNGGNFPSYAWFVNDSLRGNEQTFTSSKLKNGDLLTVSLTSNAKCARPVATRSLPRTIQVNDSIIPSIAIGGVKEACIGTSLQFTALPKNEGPSPVYQWTLDNTTLPINQAVLESNQFRNGSHIRLKMTNNERCVFPATVESTPINIVIYDSVQTSLTLKVDTNVCKQQPILIKTEASNEGASPVYNWLVNSMPQMANTSSLMLDSLPKGSNNIQATLISSERCATRSSQSKSLQVIDSVKASVVIDGLNEACQGDTLYFKAVFKGGGNHPQFAWFIDQTPSSIDSSVFGSAALSSGNQLKVQMKSSEKCASPRLVEAISPPLTIRPKTKATLQMVLDTLACKGQLIRAHAIATPSIYPVHYQWIVNNAPLHETSDKLDLSDLSSGFHNVEVAVRTEDACIFPQYLTDNATIHIKDSVHTSIKLKPLSSLAPICQGTNVSFTTISSGVGPSSRYQWRINKVLQKDTTPTFASSNFENGSIVSVSFTNNETCVSPTAPIDSIRIAVIDTTNTTLELLGKTEYCIGQTILLQSETTNAGTAPTYRWYLDDLSQDNPYKELSIPNLPSGTHRIRLALLSSQKCATSSWVAKEILVEIKDSIHASVEIIGDTLVCEGSHAHFYLKKPLAVSNPYFQWVLNDDALSLNKDTFSTDNISDQARVSLSVTTDQECIASKTLYSNVLKVRLQTPSLPSVLLTKTSNNICLGDTVVYSIEVTPRSATETYTWLVDDELQAQDSDTLTYAPLKNHTVKVAYSTLLNCGRFDQTYTYEPVQVNTGPILTVLEGPIDFCANDMHVPFVTDQLDSVRYTWTYPTFAEASEKDNTLFLSLGGNSQTDTIRVKASNSCGYGNELSLALKPRECPFLFIPNALAANEVDGNQLWQIKGLEYYPNAVIKVFNRWGSLIFHSKGYSKPWDGTYQGALLPAGTYYYLIEGVQEKSIVGDLTIAH